MSLPASFARPPAAHEPEVGSSALSTAGWSLLRRTTTTVIFTVATVLAVVIGSRAVDASPVAPPLAQAQVAPSTVPAAAPAPTGGQTRDHAGDPGTMRTQRIGSGRTAAGIAADGDDRRGRR